MPVSDGAIQTLGEQWFEAATRNLHNNPNLIIERLKQELSSCHNQQEKANYIEQLMKIMCGIRNLPPEEQSAAVQRALSPQTE